MSTSQSGINYLDASDAASGKGKYPLGSPVIRLSSFGIYLINKDKELVRITDAQGVSDLLNDDSIEKTPIAENILDMQIYYSSYPNFPEVTGKVEYFKSGGGTSLVALLADIQNLRLKEVNISFISLTENYDTRGTKSYTIPALGDRSSYSTGQVKYNYKVFSIQSELRNFVSHF